MDAGATPPGTPPATRPATAGPPAGSAAGSPADRAAATARWVLLALWLTLPVTVAPVCEAALATRADGVQHAASIALWAAWAAGVLCLLVPRTASLTVLRVLAPGAPVAAAVAVAAGGADVTATGASIALAGGVAAGGLSLTAWVGHAFVNGSSYGDERRFALRPPTAILFGPVELAWSLLVGLPSAALLLLADGRWVAGGATLAVAVPSAAVIGRALHGLSRRWLVLVPAGVVVHDYAALTDSVLVQKRMVASLAPGADPPVAAGDGSPALDLTAGAAGLVVQIDFTEPVTVVPRPKARPGSGATAESVDVGALLVAPSRPGTLLAHCAGRYPRTLTR